MVIIITDTFNVFSDYLDSLFKTHLSREAGPVDFFFYQNVTTT